MSHFPTCYAPFRHNQQTQFSESFLWIVGCIQHWGRGFWYSQSVRSVNRCPPHLPNNPDKLKLHGRVTTMGNCVQERGKEETERQTLKLHRSHSWSVCFMSKKTAAWATGSLVCKLENNPNPGLTDYECVSVCRYTHTPTHSPQESKAPRSLYPLPCPSSSQGSFRRSKNSGVSSSDMSKPSKK